MKLKNCPFCGGAPEGTVETVYALAYVDQPDEDGECDYVGESKVNWDGQEACTDDYGNLLLLCSECKKEYYNREEGTGYFYATITVKVVSEKPISPDTSLGDIEWLINNDCWGEVSVGAPEPISLEQAKRIQGKKDD